jgi:hypothetical protein
LEKTEVPLAERLDPENVIFLTTEEEELLMDKYYRCDVECK